MQPCWANGTCQGLTGWSFGKPVLKPKAFTFLPPPAATFLIHMVGGLYTWSLIDSQISRQCHVKLKKVKPERAPSMCDHLIRRERSYILVILVLVPRICHCDYCDRFTPEPTGLQMTCGPLCFANCTKISAIVTHLWNLAALSASVVTDVVHVIWSQEPYGVEKCKFSSAVVFLKHPFFSVSIFQTLGRIFC